MFKNTTPTAEFLDNVSVEDVLGHNGFENQHKALQSQLHWEKNLKNAHMTGFSEQRMNDIFEDAYERWDTYAEVEENVIKTAKQARELGLS